MDCAMTTPTVHIYTSASPFLERMETLLLEDEARYGLMLGIALTVQRQPAFYGEQLPYFAVAEGSGDVEGNRVLAAAVMTPPHGLIVYGGASDRTSGLRAIARNLAKAGWELPSVNGPEPVCRYFAANWTVTTGAEHQVAVKERAFVLRQVIHPTYSPGRLRQATLDDLDLLGQWFMDFANEALPDTAPRSLDQSREMAQTRIARGALYKWQDGAVVSLAGLTRPTPNGIAIGPVYTPPQYRGKGYASSCVAQLSRLQLDQGRAFCTLFTDLANPTSNKIYQNIGYRPVCDYTVYVFKKGEATSV
jgi:predicted GNAT family acetyltransferase